MFIHAVHFKIVPGEVRKYRKDSLMWARHARKYKGFLSYYTIQRCGYKNEYISVYRWQKKQQCDRFMKDMHDWLVSKSKAKVKVLGYYNLRPIDMVKR